LYSVILSAGRDYMGIDLINLWPDTLQWHRSKKLAGATIPLSVSYRPIRLSPERAVSEIEK